MNGAKIRNEEERHAEFWEVLWSVIGVVSLVVMFLLLYFRITR